ncbi:hypothetical protein [Burkholderia ubonensis]|uniref:hypothetical protein n=1 Tax=Burkholderia ubonensis TaxID=101571 RepID=UPI000A4A74CA
MQRIAARAAYADGRQRAAAGGRIGVRSARRCIDGSRACLRSEKRDAETDADTDADTRAPPQCRRPSSSVHSHLSGFETRRSTCRTRSIMQDGRGLVRLRAMAPDVVVNDAAHRVSEAGPRWARA